MVPHFYLVGLIGFISSSFFLLQENLQVNKNLLELKRKRKQTKELPEADMI